MCATVYEMKEEALKQMEMLGLSDGIINSFASSGAVFMSVSGLQCLVSGSRAAKIKRFEEETGVMVYHAVYNSTSVGRLLTLLYVSKYKEEWVQDRECLETGYPIAYVINEDTEECSEFGAVSVEVHEGVVSRII